LLRVQNLLYITFLFEKLKISYPMALFDSWIKHQNVVHGNKKASQFPERLDFTSSGDWTRTSVRLWRIWAGLCPKIDMLIDPFSADSRFKEFFPFQGIALGIEEFDVNDLPRSQFNRPSLGPEGIVRFEPAMRFPVHPTYFLPNFLENRM
ncbi:hypothetical protein, partial [Maribacter sp.]